ncbi:MAG: hypothetical protein JXB23_07730, partial [Candidatus Aminicenantes bacterium]|nr:hypothetical protein [Candidatus Aminicenantes bacterium]
QIFPDATDIKFVSHKLVRPRIGSKCEWEIFTGKQLKEGWSFVGYDYHGETGGLWGYSILKMPAIGSRDITLKIRVWTDPTPPIAEPPKWIFILRRLSIKGPCDEDVSEAFK